MTRGRVPARAWGRLTDDSTGLLDVYGTDAAYYHDTPSGPD
jgi:hypothetical protein